jgi:hypothetical protein
MKLSKDLLARFTSRKFLLTLAASIAALTAGMQDGILTQPEVWAVITPILAFIGIEGAADVAGRNK